MLFTTRQLRAAAAWAGLPTQAQIGARFGVSQSAISKRIKRFTEKLTPQQADKYRRRTRKGYRKALGGKRIKLIPMQLSLAVNF